MIGPIASNTRPYKNVRLTDRQLSVDLDVRQSVSRSLHAIITTLSSLILYVFVRFFISPINNHITSIEYFIAIKSKQIMSESEHVAADHPEADADAKHDEHHHEAGDKCCHGEHHDDGHKEAHHDADHDDAKHDDEKAGE